MRNNPGFFIGLLIVVVLLQVGVFFTAEMTWEANVFLRIVFQVAASVLSTLISIGLIKIALRFCDQEKGKFSDLLAHHRLFFKYLSGLILYNLIVLGGLILLIVPGIIWGIKFWFYDYFIVDKGLGPIEALKKSSAITKGAKWNLFIFFLLLGLINLVGVIFLLVGLFATIPTTMVAMAFVYRKLLVQTEIPQTVGEQNL